MPSPTSSLPLITLDTDNAQVRVYAARARELGLSDQAIDRLLLDAMAIAEGLRTLPDAPYWTAVHA